MREATSYRTVHAEDDEVYPQKGKQIGRYRLINTLNYLNFSGKFVLVNFRHTVLGNTVTFYARPTPCIDNTIECRWEMSETPDHLDAAYEFKNVLVPVDRKLFQIKPFLISSAQDKIVFRAPETGIEVNARKVKRNSCKNIQVRLIQNGYLFKGQLVDFSSASFRVAMTAEPSQTFRWLKAKAPVNVILRDRNDYLYSGKCRIIRYSSSLRNRIFVLEPMHGEVPRFEKKEFRTLRQELVPSPDIIFRHPFTGNINTLKAGDISGSGFSVIEEKKCAVLLPGMIIPELELNLADNLKATCKAQVVYRKNLQGGKNSQRLKCGLALVDMHPTDHIKLLSILYQAKNENAYLCNRIDLDRLWRFLFETGFIYPEKYGFFKNHKEAIKQTYRKLYTGHPEIARHFIYQDKSQILGHIAMVRFYNKSWLIHHHASIKSDRTRAGLVVLNQIGRFINDSHQLSSLQMCFVFCYYRPENRFPARVFGGSAKNIGDPQGCSVDNFSYFHFRTSSPLEGKLEAPWRLVPAGRQDLLVLQACYMGTSGGLMLKALELEPDVERMDDLEAAYTRCGLKRARSIQALKKGNTLKAILMLNIADPGLNLSELTNSITIIVIDASGLTKDILHAALAMKAEESELTVTPVLLYPDTCAEEIGVPREKSYTLWVLNMQCTDHYFRFIHRLLGRFDRLEDRLPP